LFEKVFVFINGMYGAQYFLKSRAIYQYLLIYFTPLGDSVCLHILHLVTSYSLVRDKKKRSKKISSKQS